MTAAPRKPRAKKPIKANVARGEHQLALGGVEYVLRPSMQACSIIEQTLDKSLVEIARDANGQSLKLDEIGILLREFIVAGTDDPLVKQVSAEKLSELIFAEGVGYAYAVITIILSDVILGGRDAAGNVKAA